MVGDRQRLPRQPHLWPRHRWLLIGQVSGPTGAGITGATVASVTHPDQAATTVATPDDPAQGDGLYWLFTAAGSQQIKASADGYTSTTQTATVTADHTSHLDLSLTASGG